MTYIGRFAPSPTGHLHLGSLITALGSWLDARANHGQWLLRIEDVDLPRTQPGAASHIMATLEACALHWDGEVLVQSTRSARYAQACAQLTSLGLTYPCTCSRREIADTALGRSPDGAQVYPGTCRAGSAHQRAAHAVRIRTNSHPIEFVDRLQGLQTQCVEHAVGDFVLQRADGLTTYQLAVVVDDADQGVTDIVRGADLQDSTARQIYLQHCLGFSTPRYLHLPIAVNASGEKLSKQTRAAAVGPNDLPAAFVALAHPLPDALGHASAKEQLAWGLAHWNPARLPRGRTLAA